MGRLRLPLCRREYRRRLDTDVTAGFLDLRRRMCVPRLRPHKTVNGHLANFAVPKVQRKIVGILWIVPIFAIDSWLSLQFLGISVYLDIPVHFEAYVLRFLSLMITYLSQELGGEHIFGQVRPALSRCSKARRK